MEAAFRQVLDRIPFPIVELHPDNGTEFFNNHLLRFFGEALTGLTLSRSRPYHKNDNRFVEQKNATLVRAYLGNLRLDTPEHVAELNALYEQQWVYYNLFQPVLHLTEKTVTDGRVRRRWDSAQTPFARLVATGAMSAEHQERLTTRYTQTNPRELRRTIERDLHRLWWPPQPVEVAAD